MGVTVPPRSRAVQIAGVAGLAILIAGAGIVQAQDSSLPRAAPAAAVDSHQDSAAFPLPTLEVWTEAAFHAPVSNRGPLRDRVFAIAGLERDYPLIRGPLGIVASPISLLPAIYTNGNRRPQAISCGTVTLSLCYASVRYPSFGVGALPLSLRFMSVPLHGLSIVLAVGGGAAWFTHEIPSETGTRFNFLAQGGADLDLALPDHHWVFLGYRHLHLSNGGLGQVNVGIDARLVAIGILVR